MRRVDLPANTGNGIRCFCLKTFKSWLRLKKHQADEHGFQNEFSKGVDMSLTNRKSIQKEQLNISEEALKDEISKLRYRQ
jgi:hypothetical protein